MTNGDYFYKTETQRPSAEAFRPTDEVEVNRRKLVLLPLHNCLSRWHRGRGEGPALGSPAQTLSRLHLSHEPPPSQRHTQKTGRLTLCLFVPQAPYWLGTVCHLSCLFSLMTEMVSAATEMERENSSPTDGDPSQINQGEIICVSKPWSPSPTPSSSEVLKFLKYREEP